MTARRTWALLAIAYAVVLLAVFWRVLFHRQVCGWDCLDEYWPDLVFQSHAFGAGELPQWNPYTLGGYPFAADPQAGVLTPVNWLCAVISWLFGVGPYLIQTKVLLLFYAALLGMHVLVWRWTRNHAAAAIAALTFAFGTPTLVHKNSALLWPLLLLPWALVAFDRFRDHPTLRRGCVLGFAAGMVGVSHPQGAFYAALIVLVYASYHAVVRVRVVAHRAGRAGRSAGRAIAGDARRIVPGATAALVIAGIWIASVYLPAWTIVGSSARSHRDLAWALSDALPPAALRELFVPSLDSSWMNDIYLGPLAVIVVLWFATARREGRLWLAIAIGSVLLALGASGHLLPWLAGHAPGFGLFRIAYRYKLITGFACAAATGLGLGVLATTEPSRRDRRVLAALMLGWLIGAVAIARAAPPWTAVLVVAALLGTVFDRASRRRWWRAALVVVVLLDLWRAGRPELAIMQTRPDVDRGSALLAKMPGIDRTWRFYANRYAGSGGTLPIPYHASYVHGVREISGYAQPLVSQRVLNVLAAAAERPRCSRTSTRSISSAHRAGCGPRPRHAARTAIAVAPDVAPIARLYPRGELVPASRCSRGSRRTRPRRCGRRWSTPPTIRPPCPSRASRRSTARSSRSSARGSSSTSTRRPPACS